MFQAGAMLGALLFSENPLHQGSSSKALQSPLWCLNYFPIAAGILKYL
jgi:hypothetical protein